MTRSRDIFRAALLLSFLAAVPAHAQLSFFSEVQGAGYPREGAAPYASGAALRGWGEVEYKRTPARGLEFRGDVIGYASNRPRGLLDGSASLAWRTSHLEIAGGLLRERWGRFTNSDFDPLGPSNTVFSLVTPELRLSQPSLRATTSIKGLTVDVYGLAGGRLQPLPEKEDRFGFAVPTRNVVERGGMGDGAIAVRVSATQRGVDWSSHVFAGRSRRPTFVPRFLPSGQLAGVDAVYTEIHQAGGELDTTAGDWRVLGEGFIKDGALNVRGEEKTYGHAAAAVEYQRFAFGSRYDVIPRLEFTADTRGDQAGLPFGSSVRIGARFATKQQLPLQIEAAYSHDWAFRAHGVIASAEKALAEAPALRLGFRVTRFSQGAKPSVLGIWSRDFDLYTYLRIEMSHQ